MISDNFYLILILLIAPFLIILYIKNTKKIEIKDNEDRIFWRENGKRMITDFKLGKICYQQNELTIEDSNGAIIFNATTSDIDLKGGYFQQGGWILSSNATGKSIYIVMRPYGNLVFFSPFAEKVAEQKLVKFLKS